MKESAKEQWAIWLTMAPPVTAGIVVSLAVDPGVWWLLTAVVGVLYVIVAAAIYVRILMRSDSNRRRRRHRNYRTRSSPGR